MIILFITIPWGDKVPMKELTILILIIAGWLALQLWILPRMGINT